MKFSATYSRPIDSVLLASIGIYQRFVSPRKGWNCAYSRLHGGTGCSGFVKNAIREHGWREAKVLARQRFAACKAAGQTLNSGSSGSSRRRNRRRSHSDDKKSDWCDCVDCFPFNFPTNLGCGRIFDGLCDCGPGDSGCIDCSPCD